MTLQNRHHRRAANLNRRLQGTSPTPVQELDPRFSPNAEQIESMESDLLNHGIPTNILNPGLGLGDDNDNDDDDNVHHHAIPSSTIHTLPTTPLPPPVIPVTTSSTPVVIALPSPPTTQSTPTTTPTTPLATLRSTTSSNTVIPHTTSIDQPVTVIVSSTRSLAFSSSAAAASATNSSDNSSSSMSTGAVVGGIGAGIVAVAVLGFAVAYFLRRSRQQKDNENTFNPRDFRRSAILMDDPPTHDDMMVQGFNPRPPTMIERKFNSPAPSFGTQYGAPGPNYHEDNYGGYDGQGSYASYSPGQILNSAYPIAPPAAAYGPFSPISPGPSSASQYANAYSEQDRLVNTPMLTRLPSAGPNLNRQQSFGSEGAQISRQPSSATVSAYPVVVDQAPLHYSQAYNVIQNMTRPDYGPDGYIDVNRSSPLDVQSFGQGHQAFPVGVSPFADPALAPKSATVPDNSPLVPRASLKSDSTGRSRSPETFSQDFPAPPSPSVDSFSRYRVNSIPPSLPEINIESRQSVASYDQNEHSGTGVPGSTGKGRSLAPESYANRFPTTPSPLTSSFILPSPEATGKSSFVSEVPSAPDAQIKSSNLKRPETVYDTEDAYGGI